MSRYSNASSDSLARNSASLNAMSRRASSVVGAISSYLEKYMTTTVGQWVSHDLRLLLYQRIQRLSLLEHGESRTGDLLTRVTGDIDARTSAGSSC